MGGTPDAGGTWSPALSSGSGVFDPTVDAAGTYTYTLSAGACSSNVTSTVIVNVESQIPINGITIVLDNPLCLGEGNEIDILGLNQLADGFYDITYVLSGANVASNTINVEVIAGVANFTVASNFLINPGVTNFELTGISSINFPCGFTLATPSNLDFEIIDIETISLVNDGNIFCLEDEPTLSDLSANIVTTLPVFWFDTATGGNPLPDDTILTNGTTYYAEVINSNGCSTIDRLAVTVLVEICNDLGIIIPDGFSPNGDGINDLFTIRNIRTLYPQFTIEIYNRNGNVIFKGNNGKEDWDGATDMGLGIGNGTMPAGVYFYILNLGDGTKSFQGRVYLSN